MALIPQNVLDTVVAIGKTNDDSSKSWIGTGFLYGKIDKLHDSGLKDYSLYLVTNKHVLRGEKSILLKFNPQTDQSSMDLPANITRENGDLLWYGHPDPEIDVGVVVINVKKLNEFGAKYDFIRSDEHALTSSDMNKKGVCEGDGVFVLGFPMGILSSDRQYVILRGGAIARIKDLYEGRSRDFLVDVFVFPGNSGGPVITKPELLSLHGTTSLAKTAFIGMIQSYIPFTDIAISQQTGRPRIVFEENSGLSSVIPAEYINETIEELMKLKE